MTFNEARAALAIGCKVRRPFWAVTLYVYAMDADTVHFVNKIGHHCEAETPSSHLICTDWEIYHDTDHSK